MPDFKLCLYPSEHYISGIHLTDAASAPSSGNSSLNYCCPQQVIYEEAITRSNTAIVSSCRYRNLCFESWHFQIRLSTSFSCTGFLAASQDRVRRWHECGLVSLGILLLMLAFLQVPSLFIEKRGNFCRTAHRCFILLPKCHIFGSLFPPSFNVQPYKCLLVATGLRPAIFPGT